MTERKKGPKPSQGERKKRIVVKMYDHEVAEVEQAFADHKQHPATWLRERALDYARRKNKAPINEAHGHLLTKPE